MKTPPESNELALRGFSTAFEVYGVDPKTLTRYFLGTAIKVGIKNEINVVQILYSNYTYDALDAAQRGF